MDMNTVREIVTVVSFAVFLGIMYWAASGSNRRICLEPLGRGQCQDPSPR